MHYYALIADSNGDDFLELRKKSAYRLGIYYYILRKNNDNALNYLQIASKRARQDNDAEIENYCNVLISEITNEEE